MLGNSARTAQKRILTPPSVRIFISQKDTEQTREPGICVYCSVAALQFWGLVSKDLFQLGEEVFSAEAAGDNLALRVDEQVVGDGVDVVDS